MDKNMSVAEKTLLLQILLEDMRGSFPVWGWNDMRMKRSYKLANELGLKVHANRIAELADCDGYRDGRHFRASFDNGGYQDMDKYHMLPKTFGDKSAEFQKEVLTYIEYPEYILIDYDKEDQAFVVSLKAAQ